MSMSWCWSSSGTMRKRQDEPAAEPPSSVALVVGSTGIVGTFLVDILTQQDTSGGPWKVYALSRRPWSRCRRPPPPSRTYTSTSPTPPAVAETLAPFTDITHIFYVALASLATEELIREANGAMLCNLLSVVVPNCPGLAHVSLQTGTMHYLGRLECAAETPALDPPFTEDMPRLPVFYYDQEDILFDAVARRGGGGAVTWSVHRPNIIFIFSPRSGKNLICTLCVYAAICRKEGAALRWPGSRAAWEGFYTASDADLIAEQHVWAALDPVAKNQAFNCSNGDIYKWKKLWPVLAGRFGLEWRGYECEEQRFKVSDAMAGKEAVWAEIVAEEGLVPTRLHEVANWWTMDVTADQFGLNLEILDCMNKSKEHGFLGFRNSVKSFNSWIDKLKACRIVP
ncbi:hypothetical protein BS78_07G113700 [Paspalum vaginatum]|nr:hypothetical protein BS78_07G113700 [Paspalum vaginatum]